MPLLWALTILWWLRPADASVTAADQVLGSTFVYDFEDLPTDNGSLPSSAPVSHLHDISDCECRARCLADHACRGYGYSEHTATCLLSELLPTPQRMEATSGDWRWHARSGVRRLEEPCSADRECSLLVPAAVCRHSVCRCHEAYEQDADGGCQKAGDFIPVGSGRLTSEPLSELPASSVDDCKASCAANLACVAFDFSAPDGLCTFYAEGITSDTGSGRQVQSFVWSFSQPDGTPPDSYQQWNGRFLGLLQNVTGLEAADACYADGAILYPGVSAGQLAHLAEFLADKETSCYVWIGMEDLVEEGVFVTSDGRNASDINWDAGEPAGANADCGAVNREGRVHDGQCTERNKTALCQFVGENLALKKLSWMNFPRDSTSPSYGNDGNVVTYVHNKDHLKLPKSTWTVDLGGPVQVTSVLYAARVNCCQEHGVNRNRFTEIRVGSDPVQFDERHSARCVLLERKFTIQGYARMFRCTKPLTGRYVSLIRDNREPVLDFAELAVFGNRLTTPQN